MPQFSRRLGTIDPAMVLRFVHVFLLGVALVACNTARSGINQMMQTPARPPWRPLPACDGTDANGDRIADVYQRAPYLCAMPLDCDGDNVPNADEARSSNPCMPANTDGDADPDFLDVDSDNDGLSDARERDCGSNPLVADSDNDTYPDVVECNAEPPTNATSASSRPPSSDFFVVLPYLGPDQQRSLEFSTRITKGDIFFLVDTTGSMQGERKNLINGLATTIIPGIRAAFRNPSTQEEGDVQFGVGGFDDYPVEGSAGHWRYGLNAGNFQASGCNANHNAEDPTDSCYLRDVPFYMLREIAPYDQDRGAWSVPVTQTGDSWSCPDAQASNDIGAIGGAPNGVPDLLEAVRGLPCHIGQDIPEAQVPALHATATGMGLTWPGGSVPGRTCESPDPDVAPGRGYPCFRPDSLPIIVLLTDALMHNGSGAPLPNGWPAEMEIPYMTVPSAPNYAGAVAALNQIGARVVTVYSGPGGGIAADYLNLARDTGTVEGGNPIAFRIETTGAGLGTNIATGIANLVNRTPQDISTRTIRGDGRGLVEDTTRFIQAITPQSCTDAVGAMATCTIDGNRFRQVIPGYSVTFRVNFRNDFYRNVTGVPQVFKAKIQVLGNGVARLSERQVYVLVPVDGDGIDLQ